MYCKNCGKKIISGAKFCKHCGSEITHLNGNPENKRRLSLWPTFFISTVIVIMLIIFLGFKNGSGDINNSTGTQSKVTCNRKTPYPTAPEFQRSISLIIERLIQHGNLRKDYSDNQLANSIQNIYNCLDIQFVDSSAMSGAEGYFLIDKNSPAEDLHISVDRSYQEKDDLLTAILLSHELTHALQLSSVLSGSPAQTCVQNEEDAFGREIYFFYILNQEEKSSIIFRLENEPNKNSTYAGLQQLIEFEIKAYNNNIGDGTHTNQSGFWESIYTDLHNMIINNPYYQKECSIN